MNPLLEISMPRLPSLLLLLPMLACSKAAETDDTAGGPTGDGGADGGGSADGGGDGDGGMGDGGGGDGGTGDGGTSDGGAQGGRLVFNELLASNDAAVTDENGDYDDFVELFNAGDEPVDLSGWTMSDDPKDAEWTFAEGTVLAPGAFLLVWCDEEPEQGELHADFKLSGDGETVILWDDAGAEILRLEYGPQTTDISYGRVPDGGETWTELSPPTPGASNG